jgi:nucleotide-binding universal stress UspA family protein
VTGVLAAARGQRPTSREAEIVLRRILWACDFSSCSTDALRWVIPVAKAYGAEIAALHVIPATVPPGRGPMSFTNPALLQPNLHHDAAAALDRCVAPAAAASVHTTLVLREGKPAREILALAERLTADLIVLGTHGRSAFERSVIGSVAEAVLAKSICPVVAVPTQTLHASGAQLPDAVLWATDFSSHATAALGHALSLAAHAGGRLLIVHAVEPAGLASDAERVRRARRQLAGIVRNVGDGHGVETIVVLGSPAREVPRIAVERKAGLIVIGRRGSHALHSILFGSTARRIIGESRCPVLAVPER